MSVDMITRLNPQTGEFRNYLMPLLGVNVRRIEVDNSGARPIFWVGEHRQAKIAKVEPLDLAARGILPWTEKLQSTDRRESIPASRSHSGFKGE
jgi:streptogramin lyase